MYCIYEAIAKWPSTRPWLISIQVNSKVNDKNVVVQVDFWLVFGLKYSAWKLVNVSYYNIR